MNWLQPQCSPTKTTARRASTAQKATEKRRKTASALSMTQNQTNFPQRQSILLGAGTSEALPPALQRPRALPNRCSKAQKVILHQDISTDKLTVKSENSAGATRSSHRRSHPALSADPKGQPSARIRSHAELPLARSVLGAAATPQRAAHRHTGAACQSPSSLLTQRTHA